MSVGKVKVNYEEMIKLIIEAQGELEELNESIESLKTATRLIDDQKSPDVLSEIHFQLEEVNEILKEFSSENLSSTIEQITNAVNGFIENDQELAVSTLTGK